MPITPDTIFHDLLAQLIEDVAQSKDIEPSLQEAHDFIVKNGQVPREPWEEAGLIRIGPEDNGLTFGEIAVHLNPNDADFFVDGMLRDNAMKFGGAMNRPEAAIFGDRLPQLIKGLLATTQFEISHEGIEIPPDAVNHLPANPRKRGM